MKRPSFGEGVTVEDAATPIVAWRVWGVRYLRRSWHLASCAMTPAGRVDAPFHSQLIWPTDGLEAQCFCAQMRDMWAYDGRSLRYKALHGPGECPGPPAEVDGFSPNLVGYGCGIYGMKDRDHLVQSKWGQWACAVGLVELGGRIWEHSEGYRAQYARVRHVESLLYGGENHITKIARAQAIPVVDVLHELRIRYVGRDGDR